MLKYIRLFLWKILGREYLIFLKEQKKKYLHQSQNITIGYKTYHNGAFVWQWNSNSKLIIGKYCSIANDVNFILDDGHHLASGITTFPHFNHTTNPNVKIGEQSLDDFKKTIQSRKTGIIIGNDVWIGMNAIILPGVIIGNGVTINAGAIVSKDVPDYAIVAGIPAQIIRMKHTPEVITKLQKIAWWDWSPEKVENNISDFYDPLETFINKWI
jgi:virginiamycin A acetyltransferase